MLVPAAYNPPVVGASPTAPPSLFSISAVLTCGNDAVGAILDCYRTVTAVTFANNRANRSRVFP